MRPVPDFMLPAGLTIKTATRKSGHKSFSVAGALRTRLFIPLAPTSNLLSLKEIL